MVIFMSGDCPKAIKKVLDEAEVVYMGPEELDLKYRGYSAVWQDNPIPWTHSIYGYLRMEELNPALYRQIIQELREKFNGVKPKSYSDAFKRLTGVSYPPQESERRFYYYDGNVKINFPGKTDDEIVALYFSDVLKLCDKCSNVIKRLEKLIKDSEK